MQKFITKSMSRERYLGFLLILIGVMLFSIKYCSDQTHDHGDLFYISGYGESVGQYPVIKEYVEYSVTFENPTKKTFKLTNVTPVLHDKAKLLLIENIVSLKGNNELKAGHNITYFGGLVINTSQLSEKQIKKHMPFIKGFRVVYQYDDIINEIFVPGPK